MSEAKDDTRAQRDPIQTSLAMRLREKEKSPSVLMISEVLLSLCHTHAPLTLTLLCRRLRPPPPPPTPPTPMAIPLLNKQYNSWDKIAFDLLCVFFSLCLMNSVIRHLARQLEIS